MDSPWIDPVSDSGSASNGLQRLIQTQHPGIASELQGAINTLRKLQMIAGSSPIPDTVDDAARHARAFHAQVVTKDDALEAHVLA